jgi:hypothetical protein
MGVTAGQKVLLPMSGLLRSTIRSSSLLSANRLTQVGQAKNQPLRDSLQARLWRLGDSAALPVVAIDHRLPSNARYARDTIWLGQVQAEFATFDDSLSLLWHEVQHHRLRGCYPVKIDAQGVPVQWMTDEQELIWLSPEQVERELARSIAFFAELPSAQRQAQLDRLRRDLSQPQSRPFRYAPSNLAREEMLAYQAQLVGEGRGLYQLSAEVRRSIRIRQYQLQQTLARRETYEKKHGLGPDGESVKD